MSADSHASPSLLLAYDRDARLGRCDGFRVRSDEGHLGFVEKVELGPTGDLVSLSVRAGRIIVLVVPAEEIERIVPEEELVLLRPTSTRFVPELSNEGFRLCRVA